MTRRLPKRALLAFLAALLLAAGSASANHTNGSPGDAPFNPTQLVGVSTPYYGYNSSIVFDASQNDHSVPIKQTDIGIPAGWHIAGNSIDPSTYANCAALASGTVAASAERVGAATITLHNDDTRGRSGAVPYPGLLYFLKWDEPTKTATLCGRAATSSSLIPAANREIVFQVNIAYNPDGSAVLSYNFSAVPGAAAGTRSIFDNAYYNGKATSILYTRLELNTLTGGNFNTDPSNKKTAVRFVWNPNATGNYTFTGTYTPCGAGDPGNCDGGVPTAVRTTIVKITNYPVGFHPGAQFTAPALWSVAKGPAPITVKWRQPGTTAPNDKVKGYVVTISADYVTDSEKSIYIVTDPTDAGVADPNPCGADGALAECTSSITLPYTSDASVAVSGDNNFSMTLVTLFKDGHRSDGRCDNGSGAGLAAPCAPGNTVPAYTDAGTSRTQFMHRDRDWPLVYRQIVNASRGYFGAWQIYVLFADLDGHQFEFVKWKPSGERWTGGGLTVSGSNSSGGVIAYHQLNGPQHYHFDGVLTTTSANALWVLTSSTNQFQDSFRFSGSRV